jgi:hypothetical protein
MNHEAKRLPLAARTKAVKIEGQDEMVMRELSWLDMIEFLKLMAQYAEMLMDEKGGLRFNLDRATELVVSTEELSGFLITRSAGITPEELKGAPFHVGLELLDGALEINLSPETFAKAKNVLARVGAALGIKLKPRSTPESLTSSSGKDGTQIRSAE